MEVEVDHIYGNNVSLRARTYCCALGQLSLNNNASKEEIQYWIDKIKKENEEEVDPYHRYGGERALFVITLPQETDLAKNLQELGFKEIYKFHRRNCYPEDDMLTMWIISW